MVTEVEDENSIDTGGFSDQRSHCRKQDCTDSDLRLPPLQEAANFGQRFSIDDDNIDDDDVSALLQQRKSEHVDARAGQ